MVSTPYDFTDTVGLADWLELTALSSADLSSSHGDIERVLRISGQYDTDEGLKGEDDLIEDKTSEVFNELGYRASAANDGYPFKIHRARVQFRADSGAWSEYLPYISCLCLSYGPLRDNVVATQGLEEGFEHLCRETAKAYVAGEGVRFGSPRRVEELPRTFREAVNELCNNLLLEGGGHSHGPTADPHDGGVDIVAWRPFADGQSGKLVLFGQCATSHWENKSHELDPQMFCNEWMKYPPQSPIVKCMFTPERVDYTSLPYRTRRAGIIFDRCRIAMYAQEQLRSPSSSALIGLSTLSSWLSTVLSGNLE